MKTLISAAVLVAAALGFTSAASAAFVNEGGGGEVRVTGKIAEEAVAVGMGRNVSIREVIRQIVPSDYAMQIGAGANPLLDKRVTWKGGQPWIEVLSDVVSDATGVVVDVDAGARLVSITVTQVAASSVAPQAPAASTWQIRRGEKISDGFAGWVKSAGWEAVFWEAPELVSDIDITFTGTLQEAITRTIEALNQGGARLGVRFYGGNKVVRIQEAK